MTTQPSSPIVPTTIPHTEIPYIHIPVPAFCPAFPQSQKSVSHPSSSREGLFKPSSASPANLTQSPSPPLPSDKVENKKQPPLIPDIRISRPTSPSAALSSLLPTLQKQSPAHLNIPPLTRSALPVQGWHRTPKGMYVFLSKRTLQSIKKELYEKGKRMREMKMEEERCGEPLEGGGMRLLKRRREGHVAKKEGGGKVRRVE
ncbi:MAG: hypothetical protein Q9222_007914 [Ikaeria aurantiellina]